MLRAAQEFLNHLDAELRRRATYPLKDEERFNWNYVPCPRNGVPLKDLAGAQRQAALDLLKGALSSQGYRKAVDIMQLEDILRDLEDRKPEDGMRDPERYFLTFFGEVSKDSPWGWRIDGHHLSLNFSSADGAVVSTTPAFLGSNPAEVPHGPHRGWRVLKGEEDLGRALLMALDGSQRAEAVISKEAPRDIITRNSRQARPGEPAGLPASGMTDGQRAQMVHLIEEYVHNFRGDLADAHIERIRSAGIENLYFAWAGALERGKGHYYRVQGPTLLIEYDNTQNDANHIHSVVRDLENDFGGDVLRRHYEESDHHG